MSWQCANHASCEHIGPAPRRVQRWPIRKMEGWGKIAGGLSRSLYLFGEGITTRRSPRDLAPEHLCVCFCLTWYTDIKEILGGRGICNVLGKEPGRRWGEDGRRSAHGTQLDNSESDVTSSTSCPTRKNKRNGDPSGKCRESKLTASGTPSPGRHDQVRAEEHELHAGPAPNLV